MDCSTSCFPVHHQLLEVDKTHVHRAGDTIQTSNPLSLFFFFLPSIFTSIKIFSKESVVYIKWPKYWCFHSASVLPMTIQDRFPLGLTSWISFQSSRLSRAFSNTTVQKHQFFGAQLSLYPNSYIHK